MSLLQKLTDQVKSNKITDKKSCRTFLFKNLKHLTFVLNNDALFDYVYRLILDQLQTDEVLLESSLEENIIELCKHTNCPKGLRANRTHGQDNPEVINPVVIISLVSQIISLINSLKNR